MNDMMDYAEALRRIKSTCAQGCNNYSGSKEAGFKCEHHKCKHYAAIQAISKQIEMKPSYYFGNIVTGGYDAKVKFYICPACENVIERERHYFCKTCGQKIDWKKEGENK